MKNNSLLHSSIAIQAKEFLMEYAYAVFDACVYYNGANEERVLFLEKNHPDLSFFIDLHLEKIGIRIYDTEGETSSLLLRAITENTEEHILHQLKDLVKNVWEEDRESMGISIDAIEEYVIYLDFLYNSTVLPNNSIETFSEVFEKGLHTIEIINDKENKYAIYLASVVIDHNYSLKRALENVRIVAKMDLFQYYSGLIRLYENLAFKRRRYGLVQDVYRYHLLFSEKNISKDILLEAIENGKKWLDIHKIGTNDGFHYEYSISWDHYPMTDKPPEYYQGVGFHYEWYHDHNRLIDPYYSQTHEDVWLESIAYLSEMLIHSFDKKLENILQNAKNKIANEYKNYTKTTQYAYALLIYINSFTISHLENDKKISDELALVILGRQSFSGEWYSDIDTNTYDAKWLHSGIISFALMRYWQDSSDDAIKNALLKFYDYVQEHWLSQSIPSLVPFFTSVFYALYHQTKNEKIAEFIFIMNDWIIDRYQLTGEEAKFPDIIGGFCFDEKYPTISNAWYICSIADALRCAYSTLNDEKKQKYYTSLRLATRFLMQLHSNHENSYYFIGPADPTMSAGGWRNSVVDNKQKSIPTLQSIITLTAIKDFFE